MHPAAPAMDPAALPAVALRRLTRADFPLLGRWLAVPHVRRWWNHDPSPAAVEADFGPTVDGADPADIFIAESAGEPFGLIQRYTFADNPAYADELAPIVQVPPSSLSIDYFVGAPQRLRRGYGSAMIRTCVASTWHDHPDAPSIVVPVNAANTASWRVLQASGFVRVGAGRLTPDNPVDEDAHFVYQIERPRAA